MTTQTSYVLQFSNGKFLKWNYKENDLTTDNSNDALLFDNEEDANDEIGLFNACTDTRLKEMQLVVVRVNS